MTRFFFRRLAFALVLGLGVATITNAQPPRGAEARLDRLADALDLTDAQRADLRSVAERTAAADRSERAAARWTAAAEIHDLLTDEQVDRLRTAAELRQADSHRADGRRGDRGMRRGRASRGDRERLTDEQRRALRAIRTETRAQRDDLADALRDGSLSDDAFLDRSRELREQAREQTAGVLGGEAAVRLAARTDRRARTRAARERALGLTDAQRDQLQTLRLSQVRQAPPRLDVRPILDADGRLDRAAFREAQRERRASARTSREDARAAREAVLTDDQREIVAIHRLIGPRSAGARRGGRR